MLSSAKLHHHAFLESRSSRALRRYTRRYPHRYNATEELRELVRTALAARHHRFYVARPHAVLCPVSRVSSSRRVAGARRHIADTKSHGSKCTPDAKNFSSFCYVKMLKERGLAFSHLPCIPFSLTVKRFVSHWPVRPRAEFVSRETRPTVSHE